jgi:hypothetical protein
MAAYTTVITHATGDVFPATDWNTYVQGNFAFLHDQQADLASAGTITPTGSFHRITGTTTITAIAAPSGSGQGGNRLLLKFQSAGCAITAGAALLLTNGPFVSVANGAIELVWDGTAAVWVEIGRVNGQSALELDYAQITANVACNVQSEATAVAVVTGASKTYDGTKCKIEFWYPKIIGASAETFTIVLTKDGTAIGQTQVGGATTGVGYNANKVEFFDTPTAAAHTYGVKAFNSAVDATAAVVAGAGGAGAFLPAWLRVTKA